MGERGLSIGYALLVVAGLAWYLGAPAGYFFVILVVWLLSGVAQSLAATTENAPSYTSSPTARDLRAMPYREYLQTPHWKRKREDKVRAAGYRCQFCNRGSVLFNVHHRTYERLGEELDEDLTVLCSDCHNTFHELRSLGR